MKKIFLLSLIAVMGVYSHAYAIMIEEGSCQEGDYWSLYGISGSRCFTCPEGYTSIQGENDDDDESPCGDDTDCAIAKGLCFPIQSNTPSAVPATTDIASNASSANCNDNTLGTTSGTSNLEAKWTANTLNLKWYDDVDGNEITPTNSAAATCTYDSGITVPSNPMSKTGYTFAGWQVKAAPTITLEDCDNDAETCDKCIELFPEADFHIWGERYGIWHCCLRGERCSG